jgi:predicted N-acyltransferase
MPTTPRLKRLESILDVTPTAWNALLEPGAPPVLRYEWLAAMEQSGSAVAARGWEASHFTLWRGPTLIGAAPAWRKQHSMGEYVYDFGWANAAQSFGVEYYPKLLIGLPLSPLTSRRFLAGPGENLPEVRAALLQGAIDFARADGCSSVHVLFSPDDEAFALKEAGLFHRSTMQYHWKNPGYATYDDYLARFDSKRRNQLKRERGAAATQGISLRTIRSAELEPAHAELAWRFYEATATRHSWGPVQLTRNFFHRAFATMPDAIELVVAEHQGKIIAGAFNLHSPTRLFGRYWGCFEEHPFLHFNVCLYHSVDDCIRAGRQVFEPGAGGEHKISRGFEPTLIHSNHLVFDRKLQSAIQKACAREEAEVARITAESSSISGLKPWPLPG